jgi:SAM-dependent methyltransferase
MEDVNTILRHYGQHDLRDRLAAALAQAGLADRRLTSEDLAPLDQFHTRGLAATVELADMACVERSSRVLDIGSGLGGPSRYLAATFGCHVRGIDLSASFVEAATFLAKHCSLADKVSYDCADALALPFEDERFDLAWTQHVAMNIADRAGLYAQAYRVLRPGGRLAIYDVVAGEIGPLHYPVPWSPGPETSFLVTPASMRFTLEQQGFRVLIWADRTEAGVAWFDKQKARATASPPLLGLHLVMGPGFRAVAANLGRNLREGRVGIVQAMLEKVA